MRNYKCFTGLTFLKYKGLLSTFFESIVAVREKMPPKSTPKGTAGVAKAKKVLCVKEAVCNSSVFALAGVLGVPAVSRHFCRTC